jgi:hypothetical protein
MKNTMEKGVFARGGAVLSKENALLSAMKMGVDFDKDFHAQSYGNELAELAKKVRYRKSKTSSGSLGRAFFEHLQKIYDKNPSKYKDLVKSFSEGGSIGFKGLSSKVAKRYAGKKVAPKYQGEYGKRYSKSEAKEVGDKVAGKVYWQQQGRKMAKGGEILQEISTHKAVKKGDKIYIYLKGLTIKNDDDREFAKELPDLFKDELLRVIPAENEEDLFYIFENYEEENRINLSGYARGGNVNTGRSWRLDRAKYNKSESYETPYASRKRKFEDGGQIGQEIIFDDNGEENTGVIKDITNMGDYVVKADDGRTLLAQRELDVISLGAMRSASTEAPRKRFGFFKDGGGVDYPNHYLEFEDLKRKINALEQQIEADYRNDEIDSYTHRNEMELERLEQKLELLMLGTDSYSDGGAVDDGFYVGQTIKLIDRNNFYGKTSKDIKKMISPYVNVELVIEEIIINKPHNMAKAYLKSSGEKVPFDIVLNKKYIETFAQGGGVSGLDDLIRG